jgi:hypothetical protein
VALAFGVIAAVWVGAGFWSYSEQRDGAGVLGFDHPSLVFWISDGLMIGGALLALAAALDNRSAPGPKLAVALGIGLSTWFNVAGAAARLGGWSGAPLVAFGMAAGATVASFIALEILLRAIRTVVRRWRGLPAPVAAPPLRLGRLLLDGKAEFRRWRAAYLETTRPDAVPTLLAGDLRAELAAELDSRLATLRDELAEQAEQAADQLRADYRSGLDELRESLPTPGPAPDADQLGDLAEELRADYSRERGQLMAVTVAQRERLTADVDSRIREAVDTMGERFRRELDSRLAALPRTTPAPRSRPAARNGSGSGSDDTTRMRAYWDAQRAAGQLPTGAELDRHVGRDPSQGYGRQLRKRWLAEESPAEQARTLELVTAGASAGE